MEYIPDRGDVIWIGFDPIDPDDPQVSREIKKRRPAFVLSPLSYNREAGLVIVCPITTISKGYPFEVSIPQGLNVTGVILADQIKSLDWRHRRAGRLCTLPEEEEAEILLEVSQKLRLLLSL